MWRPDVLDDDIHALEIGDLADFVGDLLLIMVDDEIGAEFPRPLRFAFIARGGDHARVKQLRNLNGGNAHA